MARAKIRVTAPEQGAADVTIYRANGSTPALAYTTQTGSSLHSFPVTVAAEASTDFWVPEGSYVASTLIAEVEMAGGYGDTRALYVSNDGWILRPDAPAGTGTGGVTELSELTDVDVVGVADGDTLVWSEVDSEWIPLTIVAPSAFGETLLDDADAAAARVTLGLTEVIMIAVGDETTAITTGTAKVTFRMPFAMTVTAVRANVNTVSSSGPITVDINEGAGAGTSILSTKITIDQSEFTSLDAVAPVISDTALADDAQITIDIEAAGTGAKGLKVAIIGTRP